MATSVIDVRDTVAAPHVRARTVATTSSAAATRRLPLTIAAAGLIGVLEAVGLLAVSLSGLDSLLTMGRLPGWAVMAGLVLMAGWIVLCAGSGAALIDGAGRALLMGLAYAEMVLVAALLTVATVYPLFPEAPLGLPLPALALLALAVPVGKLLLAGAPSARRWVAAGPRVRERRIDPVHAHRVLATVTLGIIGVSLGALALLAPVEAGGAGLEGTVSNAVYQP